MNKGCALLRDIIYCYGGATYEKNINKARLPTLADHYALDVTTLTEVTEASFDDWRQASTSSGLVPEPNAAFAIAALPDSKGYVIHGGWGHNDGHTAFRNQTMIFHADSGTWESIPTTLELM